MLSGLSVVLVTAALAEGARNGEITAALVALGAALVRFVLVFVRGGAINKIPVPYQAIVLGLLAVAAGILEHLAGGGDVISAVSVGLSLLGGAMGGGMAGNTIRAKRAAKISGGSIGLRSDVE